MSWFPKRHKAAQQVGPQRAAKNPADSAVLDGGDAVTKLLGDCCANCVRAVISSLEPAGHWPACFGSLSKDAVIFDLDTSRGKIVPWPLSLYCVYFRYDSVVRIFLARGREVKVQHKEGMGPQFVTSLPEQILGHPERSSFRVPTSSNCGLSVKMATPDCQIFLPEPRDISLSGMLIEFPSDFCPDLATGTSLKIELSLDKNEVHLAALVRKREGTKYAVCFPDTINAHGSSPPKALITIVRELESRWLRQRVA